MEGSGDGFRKRLTGEGLIRALEERIGCRRRTGKRLSNFDRCSALTERRRDVPGMAACPVAVQRGTLKRLDEAFRHFFRRAKARRKAANRRRDRQQDVSRRIAGRAGTVVLGCLNVRDMTRSAKGMAEEPERNVAQKADLNRAVAGTGWTAFAAMLEYWAANVINLSAAYTSRTHAMSAGRRTPPAADLRRSSSAWPARLPDG